MNAERPVHMHLYDYLYLLLQDYPEATFTYREHTYTFTLDRPAIDAFLTYYRDLVACTEKISSLKKLIGDLL